MIGTSAFIGIGVMIAGGVLLPLAVCIWWLITKKERFTSVLIGAATWFLFAMVLESIPKALLLNPLTPLGQAVMGNAVLFTTIGALLAGIFEETGRLVAFKTVLRKRTNKETGISHGIGHGGFEAMFLMAVTGIQYISYAVMINTGTFQSILDEAAATGVDISSLEALPEQLMSMGPTSGLLGLVERVFAMILHVGLSILVFYAVKKSKIGLYFLSVLLHALFDVPAALYQFGAIKSVYVVEAMLGVFAVILFIVVYVVLYKKDKQEEATA